MTASAASTHSPKPASSDTASASPASGPKPTRHQRFSVRTIPRESIRLASYNPRYIDAHAKRRLREQMRTDGLVEPLIWNATTGNLVGGHQRLAALDELEGGRDYAVTVSVVEVSPQRERELNVWLNNPAVQGQFDHAKLELLFTEFGANPFEAGFERLDLELMFDPATVEQLLATFAPPSDEEVDGEAAGEDAPAGLPGQPEGAVEEARKIQQLKDLRKQWIAGDREDLRADHIVVVVFDAAATASGFLRALKLDEGQTFVASERLGDALDEFYGTVKLAGTMERPEAADEEVDA